MRGDDQRRRDHQLDGARPGGDQVAATGASAASTLGKCSQRDASCVAGWRTVSNTASAMNASVPSEPTSSRRKISSGVVGVEERAQPVAGGVLDLELAPDPLDQLLVGADLVADLQQAGGQLGLGRGEALLGVRGGACRSPCPRRARSVSARTVW